MKQLKQLTKLLKLAKKIRIEHLLLAVGVTMIMYAAISHFTYYFHPHSSSEFAEASVMVMRLDKRGGGSGAILKSNQSGSVILTNAHVCEAITEGGLVITEDRQEHLIRGYKQSKIHDLCLVSIATNLGINLEIADAPPSLQSQAYIAGHPALNPFTLTEGYFSKIEIIQLYEGSRPCTKEEMAEDPMTCVFFGHPTFSAKEAQLITGLIQPGSSGSPVFDDNGRIAAVIFAGQGQLSFGWAVPQSYVWEFVTHEAQNLKWKIPSAKK